MHTRGTHLASMNNMACFLANCCPSCLDTSRPGYKVESNIIKRNQIELNGYGTKSAWFKWSL